MASRSDLDRLRALQRRLDSALTEAMLTDPLDEAGQGVPGAWRPPVDVVENEVEFRVTAELPGVVREEIELQLEDDRLELSGQRLLPADAESFERLEGRYGPFRRVLSLGPGLDNNRIEASLELGVLLIRIPKLSPGLGRRKIDVDWQADDA